MGEAVFNRFNLIFFKRFSMKRLKTASPKKKKICVNLREFVV